MLVFCTRKLDRVTVVRRYTSIKANQEFNSTLGVAFNHAANGYLNQFTEEYSTTFSRQYDGKKWSTGVSFCFFSINTKPAVAISFTPTSMAQADWVDFNSLVETMFNGGVKEVWELFKVSRLEIAMDVTLPFSEVVCFSPGLTETDLSNLKNGTAYIGAKYGRRSFCTYDKRKQLREVKKFELGRDLTRIEVRHRSLGKSLSQFAGLGNQFGKLIAIRKSELARLAKQYPLDFELRAFVKSILAGGVAQHLYTDLDAYAKKRICKLLRTRAFQLNGDKSKLDAWLKRQLQEVKKNLFCDPLCN